MAEWSIVTVPKTEKIVGSNPTTLTILFMKIEEIAYIKGYRIHDNGEIINPKQEIIKGGLFSSNRMKYKRFSIRYNEKVLKVKVHRLMAYQKYGDKIFKEGIEVRHLNGDSLDNNKDNIAIGTSVENASDKEKDVVVHTAMIASLKGSKYDRNFVESIRKDRKNGCTYKELMEKYHINSKGTISFLINKRTLF